jgi:peptidoglycan/LPS O-acetylase OafA/YrhL
VPCVISHSERHEKYSIIFETIMSSGAPKSSYFPALDGLRGLAILLVVAHHNFKFTSYFSFGWLGVDLFFVLSGFLITDILLRALDKPHFLRNFYVRRVLRIFPLFYLSIVICLLILPNIKALHLNADYYINNQGWLWAYLQNWLFIFKEPYGDSILLHTWSLAVEEQFYLVWPLVILLVRRQKVLLGIALGALVLVIAVRYILWAMQIEGLPYWSFYTFTRVDGLCVGSALALLMRVNLEFLNKWLYLVVSAIAFVNFGFYFVNKQFDFTMPYLAITGYTTFTLVFGIVVYEAVRAESGLIQWLLNNRFLKFFGRISYGLYVYHWPIYILLFDRLTNWSVAHGIAGAGLAPFLSAMVITVIAIIVSVLSYRYFERPFLKLKEKFA